MKALFVTWAGGGNSTPVLGLATRLIARGHDVEVVSIDDATARFASVGLEYSVLAPGPDSVREAIERAAPDIVIVDFMMPDWLSDAEASGVPTVALVHTLYDRLAAGLLTAFTTLDNINARRAALGLDALTDATQLLDRTARVLVTAPRALDGAPDVPDNVRYVGAILEEPGSDAGWQPPPGDRPLVVVSMGTTQGLNEEQIIPHILDAVADLPVTGLVNLGPHLDAASFVTPANVVLSGYVRHATVMPHAAAALTHAGLGSTVAALAFGVPLVCIPLDRDQPHNAERVAATGAGVALTRDAKAADVRDALERALNDPAYRDAAAPFAAEYDPTARAAIDELEALGS